jgi:hypothetical protein
MGMARRAERIVIVSYVVTFGLESVEISERVARMHYDATPEELRVGDRYGAFIVWRRDRRGYRIMPMVFKPVRARL